MPRISVKKTIRSIARWIAFIAPIQTSYKYIAEGKLSWLGIETRLGFIQILLNLFITAGVWLVLWMISFFACFAATLVLLGQAQDFVPQWNPKDEFLRTWVKAMFFVSLGVAVLTQLLIRFPNPLKHSFHPTWLGWILAYVGGVLLATVYRDLFKFVTRSLREGSDSVS